MYSSCIFCSAELGRNEALESFPVGDRIAFDAWQGRLWAVCPACGRWNLAPMEERWEPVEAAERLFRDARLRVQSENVGLARLPDGTRLVRVGDAMPGEMAAWRYGGQLLRRRRRYFAAAGAAGAAGLIAYSGLAAVGLGLGTVYVGARWLHHRGQQRVIYRHVPDGQASDGTVLIRNWHVRRIELLPGSAADDVQVRVKDGRRSRPGSLLTRAQRADADDLTLHGDAARSLLGRAMVRVNLRGATRPALQQAERILADAGSAARVLSDAAARRASLSDRAAYHARAVQGPAALALEMALNEESERRALQGELAALEAAWKEAEEIAAIADSLPGEATVSRLLDRLSR